MEEQAAAVNNPSLGAVSHLLQHTLRSLCLHSRNTSRWLYAVFWRILPRNYPPPNWDLRGGAYDRTRGNRRNWILAWEDGFCNFAASEQECEIDNNDDNNSSKVAVGLQPELFFKMSHEIYNYGEGFIGKVAADHGHKWVFREPQDHRTDLLSAWNPSDSQPRTWEAQFQSGVQTIALVAVREGVVQLASNSKVAEDLSFVVFLRKHFDYLESIPGFLLPHPSAAAAAAACSVVDGCVPQNWPGGQPPPPPLPMEFYSNLGASPMTMIVPSMSSLEALLSKLPPVGPPLPPAVAGPCFEMPVLVQTAQEECSRGEGGVVEVAGECVSGGGGGGSMTYYVEAEKGFN